MMRNRPAGRILRLTAAAVLAAAVSLSGHDPIGTRVTWDREIGPLVEARCVSCHRPGGRAPMPLMTYEQARPWARAIREEVLTRRMPKWPVVRGYGNFVNDPSLSSFEIAMITAWVDGGASKTRAGAPAGPPPKPIPIGAFTPPAATRALRVSCTPNTALAGRLVGLLPQTSEGGSLRVSVSTGDGGETPLLWLRNFDPADSRTYWLREPFDLTDATRLSIRGSAPCSVTFLLAARTGR